MSYSFIGNTCVSGWVYYYLGLKYNNPFIWHLILDDYDFIKVCKSFEYYINQEPTFVSEDKKSGRYLNHPSISNTYPILRLGDVNFHFIHHKDEKVVLNNFKKRLDRIGDAEVVPVAWDSEIKNPKVLEEFRKLPKKILVSGNSQEDAAKKIIKQYKEF